jgi:hypothetical protein
VHVRYGWSGFLFPINPNGSTVFKLRNVIPVRFQLTGGSAPITNAKPTLSWTLVSATPGAGLPIPIEILPADSGNTFKYKPLLKLYQFNLSTSSFTRGLWRLTVELGDGVTRTVNITLK